MQTAYFVTASFVAGGILQYAYKHWFPSITDPSDEQELIRKYLLNTSVLYSHDKPKLWIYIETLPNSRDWISTSFRTSRKINKGYIYACIQSIIHHCGSDFHICLIDKSAFDHFIPGYDATHVPDQYKTEYGMALLLYYYGGLVIPPSFVCLKPLLPLYRMILDENCAFFGERENRRLDANSIHPTTTSSMFCMGAPRYNTSLKIIADLIRISTQKVPPDVWCVREIQADKAKRLDGKWIGTCDSSGHLVMTEMLIQHEPISFDPACVGVAFWDEDLERKHRFQKWLDMSETDWFQDSSNIGQLLRTSIYAGVRPES
jgi:hypothetical protein